MIEITLNLNDSADLNTATTAVLAAIAGVTGVTLSGIEATITPAVSGSDSDSSDEE